MFHEVPQKKLNSHFTVPLVQHEIKWKLHCSPASPAQLRGNNKLVLVHSVTDCFHTPKGYLCTYSPVVHGRRGKSTVITTSVLHLDGQVIILCPRHVMGALSRYVKFLHLSSIIFVEYFHMQPQKRNILLQILCKIHHFSQKNCEV